MRARYYDPTTGQFVTRDPAYPSTRSAYGYVDNNPLNATDPGGLCDWLCTVLITGGAGAACLLGGEEACPAIIGGAVALENSLSGAKPSAQASDSATCPLAAGSLRPNFDDPSQPPGPGWEWRGEGPTGSKAGSWYNPTTRQSLHPDLDHPGPIGPHYDCKGPDTGRKSIRVFPGEDIPEPPSAPEIPPIGDLPIEGF